MNIIVNLIVLAWQTLLDAIKTAKNWFSKTLAEKRILKNMMDKGYLSEVFPDMFESFKTEKKLTEAIRKAREYMPHRNYMKKSGYNFSELELEKEFQNNNKKFKLE